MSRRLDSLEIYSGVRFMYEDTDKKMLGPYICTGSTSDIGCPDQIFAVDTKGNKVVQDYDNYFFTED